MIRITPVVKNLLIVNIGIYVIFQGIFHYDLSAIFGFRYIFSDGFRPWQIITYIFVHEGLWHLLGNMITLFFFGPLLEEYLGSKRFFTFFMVTGLGAGVLYGLVNYWEISTMLAEENKILLTPSPDAIHAFMLKYIPNYAWKMPDAYNFINITYPDDINNPSYIEEARRILTSICNRLSNIPMVGASGSILGIVMAFGVLFPNLQLMLLFPPIPIKAKYVALGWGVYSIYSLIIDKPDDNIAHWAHLGGMFFAYLLIKYWRIKE